MRKILCIFICGISILSLCGCNVDIENNQSQHEENFNDSLVKIQNEITNVISQKKDYKNFASCYVDYRIDKVVVVLVDNSKNEQNWFLKNIYNSEYIKFEQGGPYTTSELNIELILSENDKLKYNKYLEKEKQTIYFAGNVEEFFVKPNKTLKFYINNTYQTLDDSIKSIINHLSPVAILRDGGSTIYKSEKNNITMIVCNNLNGNRDIYIGDYLTDYEEFMCKNNG